MAIRDEAVLAGRLGLEAAVHFSRAIGYKDEGMVGETKRELDRAIQLKPGFALAWYAKVSIRFKKTRQTF